MAAVDLTLCKKCKYQGKLSNLIICDYCGIVGHSRGCKAEPNCEAFEPMIKKRKSTKRQITYSPNANPRIEEEAQNA